jgi:hypothetical protein
MKSVLAEQLFVENFYIEFLVPNTKSRTDRRTDGRGNASVSKDIVCYPVCAYKRGKEANTFHSTEFNDRLRQSVNLSRIKQAASVTSLNVRRHVNL